MSWTDWAVEYCNYHGLELVVEPDTLRWQNLLKKEDWYINPAFTNISSSDAAASIIIFNKHGNPIACSAGKKIQADSLLQDFIAPGLLFGELELELELELEPGQRDINGSIGYSGGTYVFPTARGKRIGLLLTRFIRSYAHDHWNVTNHAGIIFNARSFEPVPYHYQTIQKLSDGWPVGPYANLPAYLISMDRAGHLSQLRRDQFRSPITDLSILMN